MTLISLALFLACIPTALLDFAIPKWQANKNVQIEDAYKWIYQATRGGEHMVPDRDMAARYLDEEWKSVKGDGRAEKAPLWEPLCPGGEIGRLNLRPFISASGKENALLDAFLTSSRAYKSASDSFITTWLELGTRLGKRPVGAMTYDAWQKLDEEMKLKSYPAIHHSKTYEQAFAPAYRVITGSEMKKLKAGLGHH